VVTGRRFGDKVVVTRGLKAGDVVVVEGQLRLQPGAPVKVTRLVQTAGR
jgi:multidrug efflux system membrane fusion protein